jgi:hypothetical protein
LFSGHGQSTIVATGGSKELQPFAAKPLSTPLTAHWRQSSKDFALLFVR